MPDHDDPAPTSRQPACRESDVSRGGLRELEAHLVDLLHKTHPVRLGLALRRAEAEAEARSSWSRDQVAAVLDRAILFTLRQPGCGGVWDAALTLEAGDRRGQAPEERSG